MCVMASATREGAYSEFVLRFFFVFLLRADDERTVTK